MDITFVMIKPHAVVECKIGGILRMIESAGFTVLNMRMAVLDPTGISYLYNEHRNREYYPALVASVQGSVVPMVVQHQHRGDAIALMREHVGHRDSSLAVDGTIRARFGQQGPHNAIHASDSPTAVVREARLFFSYGELPQEIQTLDSARRL